MPRPLTFERRTSDAGEMPGQPPSLGVEHSNDAENAAAYVIPAATPGASLNKRDPGGGPEQLHDFDLVRGSSVLAAIEVTTATVEPLRRARAQHEKLLLEPFDAPELQYDWHVFGTIQVNPRRLKKELAPSLAELEAAAAARGVAPAYFFGPSGAHRSQVVAHIWQELGIESGAPYIASGTPRIVVSPPGDDREWNDVDPGSFVVAAVQHAADQPDNLGKLRRSGAPERHLFVYVDPLAYPPWRDLDNGILPKQVPHLPAEITTAWAATVTSGGAWTAWSLTPPDSWTTRL